MRSDVQTTRNVEKTWITRAGYEAEVIGTPMGHRCGYVTVPSGHPCEGKDYDGLDLDVHGGLTFADGDKFGFDCGHFDDAKDVSLLSGDYLKFYHPDWELPEATVKTLEFCIEECEKLAQQLKELE